MTAGPGNFESLVGHSSPAWPRSRVRFGPAGLLAAEHQQGYVVSGRGVVSHGSHHCGAGGVGLPGGNRCAQPGDAVVDGQATALNQPIGVKAQQCPWREANGSHLPGLLGGNAEQDIGRELGSHGRLAGVSDDRRQVPGGRDTHLVQGLVEDGIQHGRHRIRLEMPHFAVEASTSAGSVVSSA